MMTATFCAGSQGLFARRYNLVLCQNGPDALAALADETCAVILDVRMAGMDGFAVCEKIRENYPNLPVIFYSAYRDSKDPTASSTTSVPRVHHQGRQHSEACASGGPRGALAVVDPHQPAPRLPPLSKSRPPQND